MWCACCSAWLQRSLRIAKLEGEAQRKAVEDELRKEKDQQMVLHGRIASLLKKVEYMDKRRSDAEDKLAAAKAAARAAKTSQTGGNVQHLSEISAKDKEIASLKKALQGATSKGSPKKLASQVKQLQDQLEKESSANVKHVKSLESKLEKAQSQIKALKGRDPGSSPAASSGDADVRRDSLRLWTPRATRCASHPCLLTAQVKELKKQIATLKDEKKKAERKRDVSEQRRCDALVEQGRVQKEADELVNAVKSLSKAVRKSGSIPSEDSVHEMLRPLAAELASRDAALAAKGTPAPAMAAVEADTAASEAAAKAVAEAGAAAKALAEAEAATKAAEAEAASKAAETAAQKEHYEAAAADMKTALSTLEAQLASVNKELEETKTAAAAAAAAAAQESASAASTATQLQSNIQSSAARIESLQAEVVTLQHDASASAAAEKAAKESLAVVQAEASSAKQELESARAQLAASGSAEAKATADIGNRVSAAMAQVAEAESKLASSEANLRETASKLATAESKLAAAETQASTALAQAKYAEAQLETVNKQAQEAAVAAEHTLTNAMGAASKEKAVVDAQLATMKGQLAAANTSASEQSKSLAKAEQKARLLQIEVDDAKKALAGATQKLSAAEKAKDIAVTREQAKAKAKSDEQASEIAALESQLVEAQQGQVDPSELTAAQQTVEKLEHRVQELVKKLGAAVEARHAAETGKSTAESELAKVFHPCHLVTHVVTPHRSACWSHACGCRRLRRP